MQFLHWLPPQIREKHLELLKGQRAVRFPAAYFPKTYKSAHLAWVNLTPMLSDGTIVKTGPDVLVNGLIKTCEKYQVEFEVIQL